MKKKNPLNLTLINTYFLTVSNLHSLEIILVKLTDNFLPWITASWVMSHITNIQSPTIMGMKNNL